MVGLWLHICKWVFILINLEYQPPLYVDKIKTFTVLSETQTPSTTLQDFYLRSLSCSLQGFQGLLLHLFLPTSVVKNLTGVSIFVLLYQMSKALKTCPLNPWQLFEGICSQFISFFAIISFSELVLLFAVKRIKQTSKSWHLDSSHYAKP